MTEATEFRAKADECEKKAKEAKDAEAKRILREAAQEWRFLAATAERRHIKHKSESDGELGPQNDVSNREEIWRK